MIIYNCGVFLQDKTFTLQELDTHIDSLVRRIKESGFEPDTIVGIVTGGAVIGKILSLKMGVRFYPDYRRYGRESVHFPLPRDAKKILVVDDRMDTGETFLMCGKDIIKILKPELSAQVVDLDYPKIGDIEVRYLAFLNDTSSYFVPQYSLFDSLDCDFPWSKFEQPFNNPSFKKILTDSKLNWASKVVELCESLSAYHHPGLEAYYQNRPLSSETLAAFLEEAGEIIHTVELEKEVDLGAFLDFCTGAGFVIINDKKAIVHINEVGMLSPPFTIKFNGSNKNLEFIVIPQEDVRSLFDMCKNCGFSPNKRDPKMSPLCLTCTAYTESREPLQIIVRLLHSAYIIKSFRTTIKNSRTTIDIGNKAWSDAKITSEAK